MLPAQSLGSSGDSLAGVAGQDLPIATHQLGKLVFSRLQLVVRKMRKWRFDGPSLAMHIANPFSNIEKAGADFALVDAVAKECKSSGATRGIVAFVELAENYLTTIMQLYSHCLALIVGSDNFLAWRNEVRINNMVKMFSRMRVTLC